MQLISMHFHALCVNNSRDEINIRRRSVFYFFEKISFENMGISVSTKKKCTININFPEFLTVRGNGPGKEMRMVIEILSTQGRDA